MSATHIYATVPVGLGVGSYTLTVTNPNGKLAILANAYTIQDGGADDLFGLAYKLWTEPNAPRAQAEMKLGLVVERLGGKAVLSNVTVRFYLGDLGAGGRPLGDGVIPLLSPRGSATTPAVAWTPPAPGTYTLFAVIDPNNTVPEASESNNTVKRTITVLSAADDQLAPRVDSFTINGGQSITDRREVMLDVTASDAEPSSGLASLMFVEYEYSHGAQQWVPVQSSGWVSYETARTAYPWRLLPSAGIRYLYAWAADAAGNISLYPFKASIGYRPAADYLAANQGRVYRYMLEPGQQLTVQVELLSGDPDVYVWTPDASAPPYVSNLSSGVDEVRFVATTGGVYQIEVYGYTAAEYRLNISVSATLGAASPQAGGENPQKAKLGQPQIPLGSEPGTQIALPPAPTTAAGRYQVYLPLMVR